MEFVSKPFLCIYSICFLNTFNSCTLFIVESNCTEILTSRTDFPPSPFWLEADEYNWNLLGKDTFVHQRFKDYTLKHHFHEQNANNANTHTNTEDMLGAGTGLQCLALAVITVIKQSLLFHHSKNKWSSKTRKQKKKKTQKKGPKRKKNTLSCLHYSGKEFHSA